ncbi:DUF3379 family protein [Pseudoalteromonas sp. SSDWG2]|uniref:DUF3379 family protein n=1 Tax=Pseudoalteromonas sp. SSDWG2 TaxID=3139391 RepID=UPI003BAAEB1F
MDELEFRRRLFAEPTDKDPQLKEFAEQSTERKALVNELKALDKELNEAMNIDVPDNLADKIILKQTMLECPERIKELGQARKKRSWYWTMAASVAIACSFAVYQFSLPPLSVGEHALAHVYHEIDSLESTQRFDISEVNSRLAELGSKIKALPGEVKYARFCHFKGQKGLHLVFDSEFGPMTMFVVPSPNKYLGDNYFSDQHFAGRVSHFPQGDTILVASAQAPIDEYQSRINQAIQWL